MAIAAVVLAMAAMEPSASAQTPVSPLIVAQTEVARFSPDLPPGPATVGSCWTTSIAVSRPGAYRCMVGNGIYDPCFTVKGGDDLVCGADPALKKTGFALKPDKPLPHPGHRPATIEPWMFRLADSSICVAMTGTLQAINGESARWTCAIYVRDQIRRTGAVTRVRSGKVWMAERYAEDVLANPASAANAQAEMVPIKTVWE